MIVRESYRYRRRDGRVVGPIRTAYTYDRGDSPVTVNIAGFYYQSGGPISVNDLVEEFHEMG